ncbi:MAG: response regulator [Lachnospiraceae bacterium]|nr:response regulator [Lachnospiraceae bacterium]
MSENQVLFLSFRETFIVKSIIKKLEEKGVSCAFSLTDLRSLEQAKDRLSPLVYLYIGDKDDLDPQGMVYLRDLITEHDCEFYIIGYDDIINELRENFFREQITGIFHRPVDVGQLVDEILPEVDKERTLENRKHILVVDDSGTMLSTVKGWLKDKYRVTPVNSALNAITFLSKQRPDLILLDYEMPACSGPKFLEMLRTDVDCGDIPVIFLTGRDDADSVRSVIALKPAGYLLKSLPRDRIVGEIDAFFEKQKSMQ